MKYKHKLKRLQNMQSFWIDNQKVIKEPVRDPDQLKINKNEKIN